MNPLRKALAQLMGEHNVQAEQLKSELAQIRIDNVVQYLIDGGYLASDPTTQEIARRMAVSDPEGFSTLMRTPRPVPAQTTVFEPAAGDDSAEAEIARIAESSGIPYHEAAMVASKGGRINA